MEYGRKFAVDRSLMGGPDGTKGNFSNVSSLTVSETLACSTALHSRFTPRSVVLFWAFLYLLAGMSLNGLFSFFLTFHKISQDR